MAEYIDRVNALSYLKEKYNEMNGMNAWYYAGFQHAVGLLENFRKSDVAKVVHGKWIFNDDWWEFRCTNCNKAIGNIKKYEYCPYCGAKMDLE